MRIGWKPRGYPQEGWRKYSLALVTIVWATVLRTLALLPPDLWVTAVSLALAIAAGGNVGEWRAKMGGADGPVQP